MVCPHLKYAECNFTSTPRTKLQLEVEMFDQFTMKLKLRRGSQVAYGGP